ncbi:hypothetical protein QBC35DRAFT_505928 [Podospora australis]|uniref:Uncharacterized protein n=1 Tax=Podospora australis TaxID=1536484 RepID=A0AAN6WNA7_9PEZI|nr:hypothetical protein QBC35DRAFT_505928 [Podospora australis]
MDGRRRQRALMEKKARFISVRHATSIISCNASECPNLPRFPAPPLRSPPPPPNPESTLPFALNGQASLDKFPYYRLRFPFDFSLSFWACIQEAVEIERKASDKPVLFGALTTLSYITYKSLFILPHFRHLTPRTPRLRKNSVPFTTMFGNLHGLIPAAPPIARVRPEDVPPPTPINFPRCQPQVPDTEQSHLGTAASGSARPAKPVTSLLQGIVRPTEISIAHLEALGVHVIPESTPEELIPNPAYIPDFAAWDGLSSEESHTRNESTRRRLNTGNFSPGCQTYLDRKRELSIPNEAAYRTVRRLPTIKGQSQARLGNAYEFYKHLELFTSYWEDTTKPPPASATDTNKPGETEAASNGESENDKSAEGGSAEVAYYRTSSGDKMPADYRAGMVSAFLKLVTYDFGCNVSAPRAEPRLMITSNAASKAPRRSHFASGCTFVFRSPTTREDARAGVVEGPIAAVSARHSTAFPPPRPDASTSQLVSAVDRDSVTDLARELVAALITAQHRAREGKKEKRLGEDAWWATKPRWGGGPGGPIGREIEMQSGADVTIGDKDAPPPPNTTTSPAPPSSAGGDPAVALPRRPFPDSAPSPFSRLTGSSRTSTSTENGSSKGSKRLKKDGTHPMYDNYRKVRPPASTWDKKARYSAIGRARGADYDDVFVVSMLFHHISVVRVRVPDQLLSVLEGNITDVDAKGDRSWGKLEVRRSPWFDLFLVEDRLKAMQLLWALLGWMMRGDDEGDGNVKDQSGDIKMSGA